MSPAGSLFIYPAAGGSFLQACLRAMQIMICIPDTRWFYRGMILTGILMSTVQGIIVTGIIITGRRSFGTGMITAIITANIKIRTGKEAMDMEEDVINYWDQNYQKPLPG